MPIGTTRKSNCREENGRARIKGVWLSCLIASVTVLGLAANGTVAPARQVNSMAARSAGAATPDILAKPDTATHAQLSAAYGKLPLSFEVNRGQTDQRVKFLSRGSSHALLLTPTEAVLALRAPQAKQSKADHHPAAKPSRTKKTNIAMLRMELVGANQAPRVTGLEEFSSKSHYFIGDDPTKWRTNVSHYGKVQFEQVYPGVDLVYYGNQRQLEYDFVVTPGADPKIIKLKFAGADRQEIDARGDLVLRTAAGDFRQRKPLIYQDVHGTKRGISGSYVFQGKNEVGFQVAAYDRSTPLIIDPVLEYSTYLGRSTSDSGNDIAVDAAGNAYVTGQTVSTGYPTKDPLQPALGGSTDVFVTKLNAEGSALVYSTYFGGSDDDFGRSIAVDSAGNAYVTGFTRSTNFPTANPLLPVLSGSTDAFVTKLDPEGSSLIYSTYLGGSQDETGLGIAVDCAGNAYVTGETGSHDFPTANPLLATLSGFTDAFVAKIDTTKSGVGSLLYSTYLGGSEREAGLAIAVNCSSTVYVTGETRSRDFPTVNPLQPAFGGSGRSSGGDAFLAKIGTASSGLASLLYSTYLGGSGDEFGSGIAVSAAGDAYVTGQTNSTDFPTMNPLQPALRGSNDVFVARVTPYGSQLLYSTYLGGSDNEFGSSIAVDTRGNAFVTGETDSTDFPTANPLQPVIKGPSDAFVATVKSDGSELLYATYLGGTGFEAGAGIAVDTAGNAYVTGDTNSTDFSTVNSLQPALRGSFAGFVAKIGKARYDKVLAANTLGTCSSLVSPGTTWKYLDNGSNQGTAWREPNFIADWSQGPAELGYGDGDEATVVSYGPNPNNKYITTYFRHSFNVTNPAFADLTLRVLRDDGAVVYLNGNEVFRSNLPAGTISYTTPASAAVEDPPSTYHEAHVNPSLLVNGTNVIAVEIHQVNGQSSDVSFNLELIGCDTVRFAVIGDYGTGDSTTEGPVANLVKSWDPAFIITTGDNNYPDGTASTIDANIGQFYYEFIHLYPGSYPLPSSGLLRASSNRFFPSLGNHDWNTPGTCPDLPCPYRDYFTLPNNERYYDLVWGPVHLFAIDSDLNEPDGTSSNSTQAQWLQGKLASSTSRWKLPYMHHPPYSSGSIHGSDIRMQWPYKDWGATAVLAGHDHIYERLNIAGLRYFVNGLGGASIYGFRSPPEPGSEVRYSGEFGAMRVDATNDTITFQFISLGGVVRDTHTINAGTTPAKAQVTSPPPGSTLPSSTATFTWNSGSGVSAYWLEVGTTPGGNQIYPGSQVTNLSATVSGLPTNGSTVYVRLWSLISGTWLHNDYTYTAFSGGGGVKAQITSPPPGSILPSSTVTFTWNSGSGVSGYWLEVGTTPGGNQIYPGSQVTNLSATVSGLPTNGSTVYMRLWSLISGTWLYNDYTYTAFSAGAGLN
jgi:Calcineurin-like phosphoesterase/Beta-propeller repeat